MTFTLTTLPNGLRVATEDLPGVETVSLAISVDVGARHETDAQHGISHVLEHMAFKGTNKRSALEIAECFDNIGGHLNAYTSHEHTVYYAKTLKDDLPLSVDVLCDIVQHSTFDPDELEREQQVILQELAMHHDTPDDLVFDQFQEKAFEQQALGRSILGTADSITRHSPDDLRQFVATHYHPQRIVISAAGRIEHQQLLRLLESHLELAPAHPHPTADAARYTGGHSVVKKSLEQLQLVMGVEAPTIRSNDYYTLQLLSIILGGGMSSRLFQEAREKRGLVYTIQSFASCYQDTGLFAVYAATGEAESKTLLPLIADEWHKLCDGISEPELTRAKNQQKASLLMARENSASVAEWIGRHFLQFGEYRAAAEISNRIDRITAADVLALATQLFTSPRLTLAALGPTNHVMNTQAGLFAS